MKQLHNKIPPPIIGIVSAAFMVFMAGGVASWRSLSLIQIIALIVLYLIATAFSLGGVLAFKKAQTTVSPLNPCKSSSLVTTGVYRFSRNPMYLGLLIFLLMWAVFLASYVSLLGLVFFVCYITYFQVKPEEHAMQALFADEYSDYCQRVRRWL